MCKSHCMKTMFIAAVMLLAVAGEALSAGVELSWTEPLSPFCDLAYPLLPKLLSLETGVMVNNTRNFYPEYYCGSAWTLRSWVHFRQSQNDYACSSCRR